MGVCILAVYFDNIIWERSVSPRYSYQVGSKVYLYEL